MSLPFVYYTQSYIMSNLLFSGDYVIVTPIEEGDKVKAEITVILYKEQLKYIKDSNKW